MTRRCTGGATSMLHRAFALAAIAWFACAGGARAASDGSGTAAASFLSVGSGASVLSMGGATLASGSDLASAAWNPASLARVDALQFALTHAPMPGGATQDWLAAGGRAGSEWRWGAQALFHREGGIEGRDASNNPTGDLSASDVGIGAHIARRFGGLVDLGLGAEWVHESLAGSPGSGVAFSGGLRTDAGPFGFAVAARHVGGGMSYGGTRYDLPGVIAAGLSFEDPSRGLRAAVDVESPTHYYRSLRLGGEWLWRGQFAVRAGYRSELGNTDAARLSGPTFGLGTGAGSVWMDYAFMPEGGEGAGEHRLGITFRPGSSARDGSEGTLRTTSAKPSSTEARRAPTSTNAPAPKSTSTPVAAEKAAAPAVATPAAPAPSATPTATSGDSSTPVPAAVSPAPAAAAAATATVPVKTQPTPAAAVAEMEAAEKAAKKPAQTAGTSANAAAKAPAATSATPTNAKTPPAAAAAPKPVPGAVAPAAAAAGATGAKSATALAASAPSAKSAPEPTAAAGKANAAATASGAKTAPESTAAAGKASATATAPSAKTAPESTAAAGKPATSATAPAAAKPASSTAPATATGSNSTGSAPVTSAPASGVAVASSAEPKSVRVVERPKTVIVAQGETMAMIARRWGTTVPAIMMANDMVRDTVTPGQKLKLPPAMKR